MSQTRCVYVSNSPRIALIDLTSHTPNYHRVLNIFSVEFSSQSSHLRGVLFYNRFALNHFAFVCPPLTLQSCALMAHLPELRDASVALKLFSQLHNYPMRL
jgi:hypothetical protein